MSEVEKRLELRASFHNHNCLYYENIPDGGGRGKGMFLCTGNFSFPFNFS